MSARLLSSLLVCSLLIHACSSIGLGRKQAAGARGRLMCDGKPASGVLVKLYDDDRGIDLDDHMATTNTDANGRFELSGHSHEFTTIDPKGTRNVYTDCNDWLPCKRKFSIMIPDSYIASGSRPKKFYDAGTLELSGKFPGESRDCVH
ncbi:Transthyretin-like family protein [Aphelenchoides fujianensis]|nr:Transthyretin-like family protein [Aphelenchoides fujianensis]